MRVIRNERLVNQTRGEENRTVKEVLKEHLVDDWVLSVNYSCKGNDADRTVQVGRHQHPNVRELIIFLKPQNLEVEGKIFDFDVGDAVLIHPGEKHSARDLTDHDCICFLISDGAPLKEL